MRTTADVSPVNLADSARRLDRYADGQYVSPRRRQKAEVLAEAVERFLPGRRSLRIVDFGCADGAVPVLLLRSPVGRTVRRIVGITLLDYNDLPDKPAHRHPRFNRLVGNLEQPLDRVPLPWGRCDLVTATAFFHYLRRPEAAFGHAARLLRRGGFLMATLPAGWLLRIRRRGLPWLLPANSRIRRMQPLDAWSAMAASCGFEEVYRGAAQWLGLEGTFALERAIRRSGILRGFGSNFLLVLRKRS